MADYQQSAAPGEGAAAASPGEGQPDLDPSGAVQKEGQDLGLIGILTDIPEIKAYADRIGARVRSLRKLVVEERTGRYSTTRTEISFAPDGGVTTSNDADAPTDEEQASILAAWKRYRWPEYRTALYSGRHLPERDPAYPWSMDDPANVAVCWDAARKHILCVEVRRPRADGGKDIYIWTFWSDNRWRVSEPPGGLPLFSLDTIGDAATVFVHEGPKAAKACQALVAASGGWEAHPFGPELRGPIPGAVAHVGWLGGAKRPTGTDWQMLLDAAAGRKIVLVCDNDDPGTNAVRPISKRLLVPLLAVEFDDNFPPGFDLADPIPEKLFEKVDGKRAYIGPSLSALTQPATWATRQLPQPEQEDGRRQRGQAPHVARDEFAGEWLYIGTLDRFVNRRMPSQLYRVDQFNILVRPVSDVNDTAALLHKMRSVKVHAATYDPGQPSGVVNVGGFRHVNVHVPSAIKPRKGDPRPIATSATSSPTVLIGSRCSGGWQLS